MIDLERSADGEWVANGEIPIAEGQHTPVKVWANLLDERGERTGFRAVIGSVDLGVDGTAQFTSRLPTDLWHPQEGIFEPFTPGLYEVEATNYPEPARLGNRAQLALRVPETFSAEVIPTSEVTDGSVELLPEALAGASFGDSYDEAMGVLVVRFGEPSWDTGWHQRCGEPDLLIRAIAWRPPNNESGHRFGIEFHGEATPSAVESDDHTFEAQSVSDQRFAGYRFEGGQAEGEGPLMTPDGLQAGGSIAHLRHVVPDVRFSYFGDDAVFTPNYWISNSYHGWITGDPTDVETTFGVSAGSTHHGEPC